MSDTIRGLVDMYGNPLPASPRMHEDATPTISGVRSVWQQPVASGLTPAKLARVMRESAEQGGDATEYLTLAEEIEEREPHYRAVMTTRKLALRGVEPVIEAASEDKIDVEIADAVRALVARPQFRSAIVNVADALAKGYSVVELMWVTTEARWTIENFKWRDPRFFQFDRVSGTELRMRVDGSVDGDALAPAKFIVHVPTLKSGIPIRGGLARVAMWVFMLKSFSLKDWMAFLDVYGIPWRIGKWHAGASEDDKRALLRAVANMASDGAAIIPESMIIELIEAKANSGGDAFKRICDYLDEAMSKLVLGQTTTTDAISGGHAVSKEHQEVRRELLRADADELAATLQRDMVVPFVFFNFGVPKNGMPVLTMPVIEPEDLKRTMEVVGAFVDRGGRVGEAVVRDRIGLPDPDDDEMLLRPLTRKNGGADDDKSEDDDKAPQRGRSAKRALNRRCPQCGGHHHLAMHRTVDDGDELDAVADDYLDDWEPMMAPLVEPILKLVAECRDFDELKRRLPEILGDMDANELVRRLERATMIARGLGDLGK